jgi:hypothetical protein
MIKPSQLVSPKRLSLFTKLHSTSYKTHLFIVVLIEAVRLDRYSLLALLPQMVLLRSTAP